MRTTLMKRTVAGLLPTAFLVVGCAHSQVQVEGPQGRAMTTKAPRSVTVERGSREMVKVSVERRGFYGPVTVSLSEMPRGVHVDRRSQTIETDMATFVLTANKNADLVTGHVVEVTTEAKGMRSHTHFTLDVEY